MTYDDEERTINIVREELGEIRLHMLDMPEKIAQQRAIAYRELDLLEGLKSDMSYCVELRNRLQTELDAMESPQ